MENDDKKIIDKLYEYREQINPDAALLTRILSVIPEPKKKEAPAFKWNIFSQLRFNYLAPLGAAAVVIIALIFNFSGYLKQPSNPDFLTTAFAEETTNEKAAHQKENNFNAAQLKNSIVLNGAFDSNSQLGI